ncbi:MAG: HPr(Ser) kinase/phosphatase [Candidatus Sumerlaeia bacterium]|nr:HPr(Ser) kinase/phosphatase [Candidatus Sumerlaeia bacterium]
MQISVSQLLNEKGKQFDLRLIAGRKGLDNTVSSSELNRPGLAFAGFLDIYTHDRVQILGNTELAFLAKMEPAVRAERMAAALDYAVPLIIVTSGLEPPEGLTEMCERRNIPLVVTGHTTSRISSMLGFHLERVFAPTSTAHGVLVDVFGVGVLITGSAGVGKSEVGLELIERGHRLVADDVVMLKRLGRNLLMGSAASNVAHHMEVRGLGIVDVELLFGAGSVRDEKKVDLVVRLKRRKTDDVTEIDRLGLDEHFATLLGVEVREFTIPVEPGRNASILVEVAALQFRIHSQGRNPAQELNERLIKQMARARLI